MAKKVSTKTSKKKKKSWWTFFFFFFLAAVVSIPVSARLTFPEYSTGEVAGISSMASGSGEFKDKKPCPPISTTDNATPKPCNTNEGKKPKPSVYLYSITLNRGSCYPGFQTATYTCSNKVTGTVTFPNSNCVDPKAIQQKAEKECVKLGISPTPSKTQKISSLEYYKKYMESKSTPTTTSTTR